MTKGDCVECAWAFARQVAERDKQLLSSVAVEHIGRMMFAVQNVTAQRCAAICDSSINGWNPSMAVVAAVVTTRDAILSEFGMDEKGAEKTDA